MTFEEKIQLKIQELNKIHDNVIYDLKDQAVLNPECDRVNSQLRAYERIVKSTIRLKAAWED